jgi:hypothetical protein
VQPFPVGFRHRGAVRNLEGKAALTCLDWTFLERKTAIFSYESSVPDLANDLGIDYRAKARQRLEKR